MQIHPLIAAQSALSDTAAELAAAFCLPLRDTPPAADGEIYLLLSETGLSLHQTGSGFAPLQVDFASAASHWRRQHGGGRRQPLGRAVGLKPNYNPLVWDVTAGMGRDAFVLATLGCEVCLLERSPTIAALLSDGLRRAQTDKGIADITQRMHLHHADARQWLANADTGPDVIYLDPMYPHRRKSAAVKKTMRLFRLLAGDDADAGELLHTARQRARCRVVVKRPGTAEPLDAQPADFHINSPNTRYDVYATGI